MNDTPSNPSSVNHSEDVDWVRSDTGPFALVPEWVVDASISDRAFRLYATLARYADQKGLAWPRRSVLADRLGTSVKSIDRAMGELEALGAVVIEARFDDGGQRSNLYHVRRICPYPGTLVSPPPGQGSRPRGDTGDAQNENQVNENQGTRVAADVDDVLDAKAMEVLRLANLLADLIEANGSKRPNLTASGFLDPIRLLIDRDGKTPEQVERAIRWSQKDEFWRSNILSGRALRSKYDQMRLQASRSRPGSLQSALDAGAEYLARKEAG